jgi:hypothetical protein
MFRSVPFGTCISHVRKESFYLTLTNICQSLALVIIAGIRRGSQAAPCSALCGVGNIACYGFTDLSVCLCICINIYPSLYLCICLSIYLSFCLYNYLSVSPPFPWTPQISLSSGSIVKCNYTFTCNSCCVHVPSIYVWSPVSFHLEEMLVVTFCFRHYKFYLISFSLSLYVETCIMLLLFCFVTQVTLPCREWPQLYKVLISYALWFYLWISLKSPHTEWNCCSFSSLSSSYSQLISHAKYLKCATCYSYLFIAIFIS